MIKNKRPVYLNLLKIRLPIMGVVSFGQRLSGFFLFLIIPLGVYLLHLSTVSSASFSEVIRLFDTTLFKLINTAIIASIVHHFVAGIRFLLIDFDVGVEKASAITSAKMVLVLDVLLIAILMCWVWFE